MNTQEIDKAIGAHGVWKMRLKTAVDTGKLDASPAEIRLNDHCAFGKWLHGPSLTAQEKTSTHYKTIVDLHSRFHQITAHIAELAVAGKKAEATKLLGDGGEFATVSTKLATTMMDWKRSLTPAMAK